LPRVHQVLIIVQVISKVGIIGIIHSSLTSLVAYYLGTYSVLINPGLMLFPGLV
jgi:hypothetical protein